MISETDYPQELDELLREYKQKFPHAEDPSPLEWAFGPTGLLRILREADGREIILSNPGLDEGINDGCAYEYKEAAAGSPHNLVALQELLYAHGLPLTAKRVRLVGHLDTSGTIDLKAMELNTSLLGRTEFRDLHELYRNDAAKFLEYQCQQGKNKRGGAVFDKCDFIVSFLREGGGSARFIGVFKVEGQDQARETSKHRYYNLTEVAGFEILKEKLVIEWAKNYNRTLAPWLRKDSPVKVLEVQKKPFSTAFTGYLDFTLTFAELRGLMKNQTSPFDEWRQMLSAVSGIYLILDTKSGDHYVGAAYGDGGVWSRWKQYVDTDGNGGNKGLKELTDLNPNHAQYFQFTLLMTFDRTTDKQEVQDWENVFKKKIGPKLCHN